MSYLADQYKSAKGNENGPAPLSTYGLPASGVVPVYDPQNEGLKAATPSQAKELAGLGYKIGAEAELEAEKNSPTSKVGAFLTSAGNWGSGGLLNIGLAAAGRRGDVVNEQQAQEANPVSSGLGAAAGIAGSLFAGGPLAAEGIASKGAAKLGLTGIKGVLAKQAATGLEAAAVKGISDQVTEDTILKHPVTVEGLAASAFTDVVWNAGFNILTHGIIKSPKAIRSAFGNLIEKAEQIGAIKREMVAVPVVPGSGPIMTGFTTKVESGFKRDFATTTAGRASADAAEASRTQTDDFLRNQTKSADAASMDTVTKSAYSTRTAKTGPDPTAAEKLADSTASDEPLDLSKVADQEIPFHWDGHTPKQKQSVLRAAIEHHVSRDPLLKEMWDKIPVLEVKYKNAIAAGKHDEALELLREKEGYKKFLSDEIPRTVDDGGIIPGFRDLNDEYARAAGNPYKDLKGFKFGGEVPPVKGASPRPVASKLSETESSSVFSNTREKNSFSDSTLKDESGRVKTDNSKSSKAHAEAQFKDSNSSQDSGKTTHTYRFKFQKPPPQYVAGDYQIPFKGIPEKLGMAAAISPIGKTVLGTAALGMKSTQLLVHALNHREVIGAAFEKFGTGMAKVTTPIISVGGRVYRDQDRKGSIPVSYDTKDYQAANDTAGAVATNAESVHAVITQRYPALAETHPDVVAQMTATILKGVNALNNQAVKKPFNPTLQQQDFRPTRAQQVKFMRTWRLMANPMESLGHADPETIRTLNEVYPNWMSHAKEHLTNHIQQNKKPLVGRTARQISNFMGSNVRAMDDAKALKRLQETAGPPPKPQQGGGLGSGTKSAKISNQAVQRDATDFQLSQLGG